MAVLALWSAPRARSTAFFRSMVERGDMTVLHEPFCNLRDYGETDVGTRTFDSPLSLLAWLRDETHNTSVFLKDTPRPASTSGTCSRDRRFLAESRHAFLIRCPEEIAAVQLRAAPRHEHRHVAGWMRPASPGRCRDPAGSHGCIDSETCGTPRASWRRHRSTAAGRPSIQQALTGSPVSGPSGAGPRAGTWTQCQLRLRAARARVPVTAVENSGEPVPVPAPRTGPARSLRRPDDGSGNGSRAPPGWKLPGRPARPAG